jgi:hypothetical protein
MADFAAEVSAWCNKAGDRADQVFRAIAFDMVGRVQDLTPVDTGFLRSNWTAMKQGDSEPVAGRVSPPGVAIAAIKAGEVLVILNPVVYARRIEYGFVGEDKAGHHYSQTGRHMVAQTIAEAPQIADAAFRRVVGSAP